MPEKSKEDISSHTLCCLFQFSAKMANKTVISVDPAAWAAPQISQNLTYSIITIVGIAFLTWVVRVVRYRQSYAKLVGPLLTPFDEFQLTLAQAPLLPAPPFNFLFDNIKAMAGIYEHAPTDTHPQGLFSMMQRKWGLRGMWFLDTWPASSPRQLIIADPVSNSMVEPLHF